MTSKKTAPYFPLHMRSITYKKILILLLLSVIIILPEDSIDFILTALHYSFEGFEYLLEEIIQHIFHIDKLESQTYVFYILSAMAAGLAVLGYRTVPKLLGKLINALSTFYDQQKKDVISFWHGMSLIQKTLVISVYIPVFLYICSFFIM